MRGGTVPYTPFNDDQSEIMTNATSDGDSLQMRGEGKLAPPCQKTDRPIRAIMTTLYKGSSGLHRVPSLSILARGRAWLVIEMGVIQYARVSSAAGVVPKATFR